MSATGSASWGSTLRKLGLAFAVAACWAPVSGLQAKPSSVDSVPVPLSSLPVEAQRTAELIRSGGPFPYTKDGTVFFNRERLLPPQRRGWYREYTVKTPRAKNRGARRIVCGGARPTEPEACYYTADHYASFTRIAP
ncbi:MAG: ribonuclease N1 [Rubrivivax sp.]|nr:ribonuclease N1 [Rubrivivax sp.]